MAGEVGQGGDRCGCFGNRTLGARLKEAEQNIGGSLEWRWEACLFSHSILGNEEAGNELTHCGELGLRGADCPVLSRSELGF